MSKNESRLRLASRYIHTGNSGVKLSIFRDVRRVDRAELIVENSAFGAFHTELEIRGNDSKGLTSHQLRDLALMFLDSADALENQCEIPLEHGGSISAYEGKEHPSIATESGNRQAIRNLPDSIARYLPADIGRGGAIALDPQCEALKPFFEILRSKKDPNEDACEGSWKQDPSKRPVATLGFRYLIARRIFDLAELHLEESLRDYMMPWAVDPEDGNPVPPEAARRRR